MAVGGDVLQQIWWRRRSWWKNSDTYKIRKVREPKYITTGEKKCLPKQKRLFYTRITFLEIVARRRRIYQTQYQPLL